MRVWAVRVTYGKAALVKKLQPNVKWLSSMNIHSPMWRLRVVQWFLLCCELGKVGSFCFHYLFVVIRSSFKKCLWLVSIDFTSMLRSVTTHTEIRTKYEHQIYYLTYVRWHHVHCNVLMLLFKIFCLVFLLPDLPFQFVLPSFFPSAVILHTGFCCLAHTVTCLVVEHWWPTNCTACCGFERSWSLSGHRHFGCDDAYCTVRLCSVPLSPFYFAAPKLLVGQRAQAPKTSPQLVQVGCS